MNAEAFRHLFGYHLAENRNLWNRFVATMSEDQFTQPDAYSHGSVREQVIHLLSVEEAWFSGILGRQILSIDPASLQDRDSIRAHWDTVEQHMRDYLARLEDGMLLEKPIREPEEDQGLVLWQVLLHVVNHGTDHRAQLLRRLNDLGFETPPQDYIFYVYDHPAQ